MEITYQKGIFLIYHKIRNMVICIVIYSVFLVVSLRLRKIILKIQKKNIYLSVIIYLLIIYPVMSLLNYILNYLKTKEIYFNLGHANIYLLSTLLICYLTAIIISINILVLKKK